MNGTTLYEFGHAFGFIHEHSREKFVKLLNEDKVKENYRRTQGWGDEKIKANVLTPLKEDDGAPFDVPEN
ncbi:hypothetical protein OEA41_008544 [Lepraria neglecta]|uniref:Uncharacterized protein n=1 Tax=Lepraria neglecta TaxID=209136 RepID=A0AAD9ZFI6_9LECA|nr:hypothetical protein OEA41_008544 [Lepraria neglecta]